MYSLNWRNTLFVLAFTYDVKAVPASSTGTTVLWSRVRLLLDSRWFNRDELSCLRGRFYPYPPFAGENSA